MEIGHAREIILDGLAGDSAIHILSSPVKKVPHSSRKTEGRSREQKKRQGAIPIERRCVKNLFTHLFQRS